MSGSRNSTYPEASWHLRGQTLSYRPPRGESPPSLSECRWQLAVRQGAEENMRQKVLFEFWSWFYCHVGAAPFENLQQPSGFQTIWTFDRADITVEWYTTGLNSICASIQAESLSLHSIKNEIIGLKTCELLTPGEKASDPLWNSLCVQIWRHSLSQTCQSTHSSSSWQRLWGRIPLESAAPPSLSQTLLETNKTQTCLGCGLRCNIDKLPSAEAAEHLSTYKVQVRIINCHSAAKIFHGNYFR